MKTRISISRKRDNVYLKLMGDFNKSSASQVVHALQKLLTMSLKASTPGSMVFFTFRAQAKISLGKNHRTMRMELVDHVPLPLPRKKPPGRGRTAALL